MGERPGPYQPLFINKGEAGTETYLPKVGFRAGSSPRHCVIKIIAGLVDLLWLTAKGQPEEILFARPGELLYVRSSLTEAAIRIALVVYAAGNRLQF